jgi:outer membrane protein assembly factor BamB
MKTKHVFVILLALTAAMLLSGCGADVLMGSSWPGLATDGEVAYLADGQHVYAVSLSDGREIWRYPEEADNNLLFIAQPAVAEDGTLIVGSGGNDHRLVALDTSSGVPREKWTFNGASDRWIGTPLVVGETVFAPNVDGSLYVLDTQGRAIETVDLGGSIWSQPVADESKVYVSSMDHQVYAVDLQSYDATWSTSDLGGAAPGSPLLGPNGDLFVGTFNAEIVRVNPANGGSTPFVSAANWVWGAPVADGGTFYFGDLDGFFYAVDSASGEVLWSIQPDGPIVGSALVMTDFIVFATESGTVYAVDRDGNIVWSEPVGGKIYTTPVAGKDRIVVAPTETDYKLVILDTNGNQINTFEPEN